MTTTKKCWSCDNTTAYSDGWCADCIKAMPFEVCKLMLELNPGLSFPEPYAGAIRLAIANTLRQQRRPPPTPRPKTKGLSLEDLGL